MIVVAEKDVFFAAEMTEIANKYNKELMFVADDKELTDAAKKKPEIIFADLEAVSVGALKAAKLKKAQVIGYKVEKGSKATNQAEKICDAVISREEFKKKLAELLSKM